LLKIYILIKWEGNEERGEEKEEEEETKRGVCQPIVG